MTNKQKQCLLAYLGYYDGQLDGLWGEKSQRATIDFQRAYMEQTDVDGIFGAATEKRILEVVASGEKPVGDKMSATEDKMSAIADGWKDIRYFTKAEFKCKCGGKYCNGYPVDIDMNMVKIADKIRARIGDPIPITSGLRCKIHNANVGGVSNSQHLYGKASDLGCPSGSTPSQMASIAEEIMGDTGGIGTYSWGIHIDTRSTKSRWNG